MELICHILAANRASKGLLSDPTRVGASRRAVEDIDKNY